MALTLRKNPIAKATWASKIYGLLFSLVSHVCKKFRNSQQKSQNQHLINQKIRVLKLRISHF